MRCVVLVALLAVAGLAQAAPREETWMSVTLDGRKIGHLQTLREERDGRIVTTQALDVQLERAGIGVDLFSSETSEETADGKPLAFSARSRMSGSETLLEGRLRDDGQVEITTRVGGQSQTHTAAWPAGALLAEGLRRHALRAGLAPGTRYSDLAYQPSSADAVRVDTAVRAAESVDLPGGRRRLHRLEQTLALPGAPTQSTAWVDAQQNVQRMTMDLLGFRLEMLACSQACATAPNQGTDMLQHSLLQAPRALTPEELRGGLRYTLAARAEGATLELPGTDEQRVQRRGATLRVDVAAARGDTREPPVAADRGANAWLQSDAPELRSLAHDAAGNAQGDAARMQALETFVRGYIRDKNLSVGYASALEVVKTREGDCTEHAVLLAALGRALGIPTRVVDGLAYTGRFGTAERVFVPHAWVQAWVDGHWRSYDAALNGFDAGHIALSVGDGDPWRFYAGLSTLGNLRLQQVEALPAP